MPTLFEHAGGLDALHGLDETFYMTVRLGSKTGKIGRKEKSKEAEPCVYGLSYPK